MASIPPHQDVGNPSVGRSTSLEPHLDIQETELFALATNGNCSRIRSTHTPSHHREHLRAAHRHHGETTNIWPTRPRKNFKSYMSILILMTFCFSMATASMSNSHSSIADISHEAAEILLAELAENGTIITDQRPPPQNILSQFIQQDDDNEREPELRRRQSDGDPFSNSKSSSASSSPTSTISPPTSSGSATTTSASQSSTATTAPSPLPVPFDSNIGTNFTTASCPAYLSSVLNSPTFKSCLPFSLLVQNSYSFFQAAKSIVRITQTLDATCSANVTSCTTYLSGIASNLTNPANCAADFTAQNPVVTYFSTGLIAYKPLYQASCLKNPSTPQSNYCFADAITNSSSPTDSYIYYLPLNMSLPASSQPSCNACLQNTMAVFAAAAANRSQPVASTYVSAASQVNNICGPGFVNATIPQALINGGVRSSVSLGSVVLAVLAASWLV